MTFATRIQLCCLLCLTGTASAIAQQGQRKDPSTQEQTQFSPGIVTVIPGAIEPEETFDGPLTLKPFLDSYPQVIFSEASGHPDSKPHFDPRTRTLVDRAKEVIYRRTIFCFEFSFKPLRQMYIDIPRSDGRMQRKLVWYMVTACVIGAMTSAQRLTNLRATTSMSVWKQSARISGNSFRCSCSATRPMAQNTSTRFCQPLGKRSKYVNRSVLRSTTRLKYPESIFLTAAINPAPVYGELPLG